MAMKPVSFGGIGDTGRGKCTRQEFRRFPDNSLRPGKQSQHDCTTHWIATIISLVTLKDQALFLSRIRQASITQAEKFSLLSFFNDS
mgnify:CR=1